MPTKPDKLLSRFFKSESTGGLLLIAASILAIIMANSPLKGLYEIFLATPLEVKVSNLEIAKPLLLWINDGLMAIFFFLIGLELKREFIEGQFANRSNIILPGVGAIGGMVVPALIYYYFNQHDPVAVRGWAIPAATDIAFALGILSLLGSRVPTSMKVFLTSLAIFDDIGAITIIALFYTSEISITALVVVVCCLPVLTLLNRRNVTANSPYILFGIVMWVATLKSGVHATLSGLILAVFIPMRSQAKPGESPLKLLEQDLQPLVAFFVLPLFAFANAGISLSGVGSEQVFHSVPVGITLGLFLGKQLGIFSICALFIKLKITQLPQGVSWLSLYGTAVLCGIGFTMSLFIGSLAFEQANVSTLFDERIGIILGSITSGLVGYLILYKALPAKNKA